MTTASTTKPSAAEVVARARRIASGTAISWLRVLLTVIVILLAVITLVVRLGVPMFAGYKAEIEAGLGDYLKAPVTIDQLSFRWRRFGPELTATGLQVTEGDDGRVAIDEALLDVNLLSTALRRTLVINELTLVGADLAIERLENGTFRVHGLTSASQATKPRPEDAIPGRGLEAVSWLFNARRVGLLDTQIRIIDNAGGTADRHIILDPVELRAENTEGEHRLRISAELPHDLGNRVEFAVDLTSTPQRALDGGAHGRFHIMTDALDVGRLLDLMQTGLGADAMERLDMLRDTVNVGSGRMALNMGGVLENGRVSQADGTMEMTGLTGSSGVELAETLGARLRWRSDTPDDWQLVADGLEVNYADKSLLADTLRVSGTSTGITIEGAGNEGSLELAVSLSRLLPTVDKSGWIDAAQPKGRIAGWRTVVEIGDGLPNVDMVVSVPELSFKPALGGPGLSSFAMSLIVDDSRGHVEARSLSGDPVILTWPDLYGESLELNGLSTILSVAPRESGISVEGPVTVATRSAGFGARIQMDLDAGESPYLDVSGDFALDDATDVARLLPDKMLGEQTVTWFRDGLKSGSVTDGSLRFVGRAVDFPFDETEGEFKVSMRAHDIDVDWDEAWPTIESLNGTVNFDGVGFSATSSTGRVASMDINRAVVTIDDLRVPRLVLDASGTDALGAMINFANTGPLADTLRPALEDVTGSGNAGMDLIVESALSAKAAQAGTPLSVNGRVFLRDNPVAFEPAELEFDGVTGAIEFGLDGVAASGLRARWLGRLVTMGAIMQGGGKDRRLILRLDGLLEGSDVLSHYGLPVDRFIRGASAWAATLEIPFDEDRQRSQGFKLSGSSDLLGSELLLPAPLYKSASQARRMTVSTRIMPDERLARWFVRQPGHAEAVIDVLDEDMFALAIGLGKQQASTTGTEGIRVDGHVDVLDVDGWVEALGELISDLPEDEERKAAREPILAVSGNIVADRSMLRSMPLGRMQFTLNSDEKFLNAVIQNRYIRGNARYPRHHQIGDTTPMKIRLSRVEGRVIDALLGEAEPDDLEEDDSGGLDPRELPPVEARVLSLGWEQLELEGFTIRTEPDIAGLNIVAFGFSHDNLNLLGTGYWRLKDPQGVSPERSDEHETRLSLVLQSSNFGRGFGDIGIDNLIGRGAGRARAELTWAGPAWSPDFEILNGSMSLDLERGLIRSIEPGAGRLIGLFAFQALPQRLSLDFSDVTGDGLAFTTLDGEATIKNGIVSANLVRLEGPIGVVDVSGQTDLVVQAFEQRVTVLPRVSAALPIIGIITGGAGAGIGALLAGGLLKAMGLDIDRIGLREFRLHGSWEDPQLDPWSG